MFRNRILQSTRIGSLYLLETKQELGPSAFIKAVNEVRKKLEGLRIKEGSRIILCLSNPLEFCSYAFAAWDLGACIVPLPSSSSEQEIRNIIKKISPTLVVWPNGKEESLNNPVYSCPEDLLILFTSGSSGRPKGVVLTEKSVQAKLEIYPKYIPVNDMETTLCLLPLSFGHGLISNFLFPFLNGKKVVLGNNNVNNVSNFGAIIDEHDVSAFSSVPALLKAVIHYSVPPKKNSLKRGFCASAPLEEELWEETRKWSGGVRLRNIFGMTELASWAAGPLADPISYKSNTIGVPWEAEARIENGELLMKAPYVMKGYHDDPDLTSAVLNDGWLRTGDLASIDADGIIHLQGRMDDIINLGGMKVSPMEVDLVLKEHPDVKDACTLGLTYGIGSAVILKKGCSPSPLALIEYCKVRLAPHKVPNKIKFVDSFPLNGRGKIDKSLLKQLLIS